MTHELPEANRRAILHAFPDTGAEWIENFPGYLASLLEKWQLNITGIAEGGLAINRVYFVQQQAASTNNTELVLKVGHPHPGQQTEAIYLALRHSERLVRLLDMDATGYGFLLERLAPGTQLRQVITDREAVMAALELHRNLPVPIEAEKTQGLPTFSSWLEKAASRYRNSAQQTPVFLEYLDRAEDFFRLLNTDEDCLLHGDLHHENILRCGDQWKAIDPKGALGPAALEAGRFLHNFIDDEVKGEATEVIRRTVLMNRIQDAAKVLRGTEQELANVTFVDLVLSTAWTLNAGGDAAEGLSKLSALAPLTDA